MEKVDGEKPLRPGTKAKSRRGGVPHGKRQGQPESAEKNRFPPVKVAKIHHPFTEFSPRKRLKTLPHALGSAMSRQPLQQPTDAKPWE